MKPIMPIQPASKPWPAIRAQIQRRVAPRRVLARAQSQAEVFGVALCAPGATRARPSLPVRRGLGASGREKCVGAHAGPEEEVGERAGVWVARDPPGAGFVDFREPQSRFRSHSSPRARDTRVAVRATARRHVHHLKPVKRARAMSHMRAQPGKLVVKASAAVVRSASGSQSRRTRSRGSVWGKGGEGDHGGWVVRATCCPDAQRAGSERT